MRELTSHQQEDALGRMRDVLQEDFLLLQVERYQFSEILSEQRCVFSGVVRQAPDGPEFTVEGSGVGLIDAFFSGLIHHFASDHPSLSALRFTSFAVRGLMAETRQSTATDAKAQADVGVTNSYGREFVFRSITPSVTWSSLDAVVSAVEYFVNSERAYRRIQKALDHYRAQGRSDLVAKYTDLLAEMVRNTSYSEIR